VVDDQAACRQGGAKECFSTHAPSQLRHSSFAARSRLAVRSGSSWTQ
jgi:hypothetical protein